MAEGKSHHHHDHHQVFQDSWFDEYEKKNNCTSSSSTSSIGEESMVSNGSSSISSSDTADDASSSASSSFSSGGGSLYDLSEIMAQLPIKRGLSKFYQGKSESFTSLARVESIEDLAKKVTPYRRHHHLKASKSYGTGLNHHSYKPYTLPKPIISKKTTRGGSSFSSFLSKRGSFVSSNKPPLTPLHKNLEY
ncbi:hypothetical protein Salat_1496800 [Sesamum alatum]|uniref:Oxidative stress 3 n=1 Tax=Sesamum alatum TaxID=300844 RepID=A0AAE2CMG0_9LAMI|nr:hypothetical protein Salat_1496800 [Sesamum alatum]